MAKNKYYCACGKVFEKSTNANDTGYRFDDYSEAHECYGCPFVLPVTEGWGDSLKIKTHECRASHVPVQYGTTGQLYPKAHGVGTVSTLDMAWLRRFIMAYLKEPGADTSYAAEKLDAEDWERYFRKSCLSHGRRTYSFIFQANKKGLASKVALTERFFNLDGSRKSSLEAEDEKELVLRQIANAKAAAQPDSAPSVCPHFKGIAKKLQPRGFYIDCELRKGANITLYDNKSWAVDHAKEHCQCAEQYPLCLFCKDAQLTEEELLMTMEYPIPSSDTCPLYGGARAKKGGGHHITCGSLDIPCADDGTYMVKMQRCRGDKKADCRPYLVYALKSLGHSSSDINGKNDAELRNMLDGHQMLKADEPATEIVAQSAVAAEQGEANSSGDNTLSEPRPLTVITAEINCFKAQAAQGIIEIGRRLTEAKAQLQHGAWLEWLQDGVDISPRTAQRFMQLADEYEDASPVTYLGYSKMLALLAVPADEREQFVDQVYEVDGQQKTVDEMSKRQLEQVIKERDEEKRQRMAANKRCDLLEQDKKQAYQEADRLQARVKELEGRPIEVAVEEPSAEQIEVIRTQAFVQAYDQAKAEYVRGGAEIPREILGGAAHAFCNTLGGSLNALTAMVSAMDYKQAMGGIEECAGALRAALTTMSALKNNVMIRERQRNPDAELEDGF